MDNTTRFVFPTGLMVAVAREANLILLSLTYKLSPDEPEEFQQRYAMDIEQATSLGNHLLEAAQDLTDSP